MADYDAGDQTQVKKKKTKAELVEDRDSDYLKRVLDTYEGRATIWNILSICGIYDDRASMDNWVFHYQGRRSVGIDLIQMIEHTNPRVEAIIRDEAIERELNG